VCRCLSCRCDYLGASGGLSDNQRRLIVGRLIVVLIWRRRSLIGPWGILSLQREISHERRKSERKGSNGEDKFDDDWMCDTRRYIIAFPSTQRILG